MKHRTLAFVDSEKYLKILKKEEMIIVGAGDVGRSSGIKLVEDYKKVKKVFDAREEGLKWMKAWPGMKISDVNFKELTAYDRTSLWWFTELWFWNAHSSYDYSILDIFHSIEAAERILNREKPDKVIVAGDSLLASAMLLSAEARGIEAESIQPRDFKRDFSKMLRPILVKNFKKAKEFLRKMPKADFLRKTEGKIKVLVFTHPSYRQATVDEAGKKIVEDTILSPVLRELKDCDVVVVDTDPFVALRLGFTFSKECKHIESYTNAVIEKKIFEEERLLKEKWALFSPLMKKVLSYKRIDLMHLLEQKFSELFRRKFSEAVKYIELSKEAVRVENPDVVVVVDEYGLYGKAAVYAAKLSSKPVAAVQHGIMSTSNVACLHTSEELSNGLTPLHNPIPDVTLVNGEYYKTFLESFGYPKGSVIPTGQPKYDILSKAEKIFSREKTRSEFGIAAEEKMLLLASSTQAFPQQENEIFMRSLFKAAKEIPGLKIVVKLHPNEYDTSLHKKLAEEAGIDVKIVRDANTFELLYASDAMITVSSTVALEAMILGKPVIIANLTGQPDQVPYVERKAAVGVYKDKDMMPTIKKVLAGKTKTDEKKFVMDYAFKIDGMAAKRIADVIRSMVK